MRCAPAGCAPTRDLLKTGSVVVAVSVGLAAFLFALSASDAGPPYVFANLAYGHGLGVDRIQSIPVHDKKIAVDVEMPQKFEGEGSERVTITAIDVDTGENVADVVLAVGMIHAGETVFQDNFFAGDGVLRLDIESTSSDSVIEIDGVRGASPLEAWYSPVEEGPVTITSPGFGSDGLYTFEISILAVGDLTNTEGTGVMSYFADLSVEESARYVQEDSDGDEVQFGTKSYFDGVSSLQYDADSGEVVFEMPFDWSERRMSHIPVVHAEVHFPKSFAEFLSPGYEGSVNGVGLFRSSVIVDDYSMEDERIVHFVLLQDHLRFVKNEMKKELDGQPLPGNMVFKLVTVDEVSFPLDAYTKDEEFLVNLSWDPPEIQPEVETIFVFTIRDGRTGEPLRDSEYTFVIVQNGEELHRASGNAKIGGHFVKYTFEEEQTGPTTIRFENIRGIGQETEFGILVVPEFGTTVVLVMVVSVGTALFFASWHQRRHLQNLVVSDTKTDS